jgi:hypothetical protein
MRKTMNKGAGRFSAGSYKRNNSWGIERLKTYLRGQGFELQQAKEEDFGIDVTAFRSGKKWQFEVEVKTNYPFTCKEDFKFPTVSFLARKEKWKDRQFWYVIICKETEAALMASSDDIFQEEYKEELHIATHERQGGDLFYRMPKEKCKFFSVKQIENEKMV